MKKSERIITALKRDADIWSMAGLGMMIRIPTAFIRTVLSLYKVDEDESELTALRSRVKELEEENHKLKEHISPSKNIWGVDKKLANSIDFTKDAGQRD